MRFPNHVSITRDITMMYDLIPIIATVHQQLLVTPPVLTPVPMGPYVESPAPIWWIPGYVTGKHELTTTVFHNHLTIAQEGHDLGMMLIHVAIPPNDLLIPVNMLASSREAKFEASEVIANGKPIACCTMIDWAVLPTPMKACSLIPAYHVGCGMSLLLNSVIVGMSVTDMIAGYVSAILDLVLSLLDIPEPLSSLVEFGQAQVGPLIRLAGQEFGASGDAEFSIDLGGGLELTVGRSGTDHRWSGGAEVTRGGDIANVHAGVTVTEGAPGSDGPEWEAAGGADVFSDGSYEATHNSRGETETTAEHPGVQPSLQGGLLGPPTSGGEMYSSGSNPVDNIPGWSDLPTF